MAADHTSTHSFRKKLSPSELQDWREKRRRSWERLDPQFRTPRQLLGRQLAIGCVSLEITQRCNLDCTLCYLSDLSESIPDPPIAEIKRRADLIVRDWGPNTNVQISGGDPTLRKRDELIEIFRYCRSIGLLPALFTNGILAKRELLAELCDAGMTDVAFHVDLTQERPGYETEMELNEIRREYIENVRGLPTAVIFNTTVFSGNVGEVPELVRFFRANADVVGMCSFQLGADTGRGVDTRPSPMRLQEMRGIVGQAFPHALSWDSVQIGHPSCHSIVYTAQAGDHSIDLGDDPALTETMFREFPDLEMDRTRPIRAAVSTVTAFMKKPKAALQGLRWVGRTVARNAVPVARNGFKAHKLSVFIQNFMDADNLEAERVRNCSFMVATAEGTVSMCLHNARRNEFLLMGVDRLIKNPVKRGKRREKEAELPPELRGPVTPGAGGLPAAARLAPSPERSGTATSMKGKRVVLTGASRGIGRETALALGKMGADLSLVVRDRERGQAVADEVRALAGGGDVEVFIADLSSSADIRRVAAEILAEHDRIDVLVNNAGALLMERQVTKDGYEATFATNHLGYFLLTKLLLDAIKKAPAGRIVNVASDAHYRGSMKFDDLMGEKKYAGWSAYSSSKLANVLFTAELARRLEGTGVTANSLHPGVIASGFARNNEGLVGFLAKLASPFLTTSEDGAKTTVFLATDPSVAKTSGLYFANCKPKTPSREARDPSVAKRLWDLSEGSLTR